MAENLSLNINVDILKKLDEADKKLQQIATHSEEVSKAMKQLSTNGINSVVNSLSQMNTTLTKLAQNNSLANVGTQANQSVDAINKMIAALAQLTNQQQLRLQTQQAKLDYKKEANDIKELAVAENERSRALDRQNKANAANDKHRQALETKRLANDTKELMNIEQERGRQLVLQNQKNIAAYTKQSVKLKQQINEINRLAKAYQQMPTKLKQVDLNKIITSASKAKTINQHIVAIHNLKNALRDLDTTSKNYKNNVNRINAEIRRNQNELNKLGVNVDRVKNKKRKLMDTAGQLQRKLSLLFSVSQIVGYFNKMVAIRKEMELQQKSLQVLLQNKDEADKLWNQVIDLAVKSPFRVKELVTYTKQLAAYRIESDQLFDTTKRLSDVSAGLGVDMQRLILAYGQIRAAGFLRGTELRQLTEAGLPMLDELSKYLTEIEGRTIRTGDVFEMISKRMVSFKDVQEVFKRMTSEGGVFFNMQEEQAKTLAGSISNLHDSIDLMLNAIGKENDATLKGAIATVRSFVENWKEVKAVMEAILPVAKIGLTIWGVFKIANSAFAKSLLVLSGHSKTLMTVLTALNPALSKYTAQTTAASAATKMFWTAAGGIATLGIGFALYAIGKGLTNLYLISTKASREAKELKKNLDAIILEDVTNLEKQVDGFKDLATRLGEANEGSQERREIISALNNQYGEYLDFVVDEKTSMDELANSYDKVVDRMKEKAALASFEKGFQAINDSYGRQLEDATEDFYSIFQGASIRKEIDGLAGFTNIVPTKKEVDDIFNLIQQRIREKNIEEIDSLEEQRNLLNEIIKGYYGEAFSLSSMPVTSVDLIDIFIKRKKDELKLQEQINQEYKKTLQSQEANLAFEQLQNEYTLKQKEIRATEGLSQFEVNKQLKNLKTQLELDKIELKFRFGEISQNEMIDAKNKIWKWASETIMAVNEQIERELSGKFSEEEYSQIMISQEEYEKGMSAILKNTVDNYELHNQLLMDEISLKDAGKQFDEDKIKYYERLIELDKFRAKALGIELDLVQKIDKESVKSINAQLDNKYQISLENSYKSVLQLQEEANKKRQDAIKLEAALLLQREKGVAISEATLQEVQADVAGWTKLWELLGGTEKEKKPRHNSLYDERIKVIDDMNKKYKELNKTLGQTEALQGAFEAYIDAFATAYEGISWVPSNVRSMSPQEFASKVLNFPDEDSLVDFLDRLSKEPMKTFEKIKVELAKGEYVYDIKTRIKAEDDKELLEQIKDMFSGYEMSIELQKMNIPPDLAKQLFNIDSLTLPELKNKLIELKPKFEGKEMLEEWDKLMKEISDKEEKEQEERLKKYTKYLLKAQSERVKIKLDEMRQLAEIDKEDKYSQDQKEVIKRAIRVETQEKIDKEAWEDFKKSDMYSQMFDDLEHLGTQAISKLKQKLESLKESLQDLPPTELKEIMSQINKLEDLEMKYNPFSSLRDAMKEVNALRKEGRSEEFLQLELQSANERIESTQEEIDAIDTILNAKRENISLEQQSVEWQAKYGKYVGLTEDMLNQQKNELSQIVEQNQKTAKQAGIDLSKYTKARKATQGFVDNVTKWGEAISGVLGGMDSILDAFGVAEDDSSRIFIQSAEQIANMIVQTVILTASLQAMGVAANQALGVIGWIATALQAVAMLFASIFAAGDKSKERQIKKEQEAVEKLQRAYEKLAESIDNAYNINSYERYIDNAQQNLKNQIAATERMIQAEEDKKKTDKDKIKDWKNEIEDMRETLKELEEERVKGLGGFGSESEYKSATEAFVSAWLDAYKETGDGLSGLEEQFNEFFTNMVKNQLMMRGVDRYLDGFYKQFDAMFAESSEQGGKVTKNELESLKNLWASTAPELNEFMENLIESLGIAQDLTSGTSELSGLQRGIQGVTEETAQIIEAYLNSIRFFVAEQNTYLSQIASALGNTEVENPMVGQLRIIAQQTTAINTLLQSLTKGGHSLGGVGLKVFIS